MSDSIDDDEDGGTDAANETRSGAINDNDSERGREPPLAPYRALDRLLRYARSEALSQHREKAARLIEAAIISLGDTTVLSKH